MIDILNFIHWNVNPEIFHLGPLSIRWYGLLFAAGFLSGYYVAEKILKSENVDQKWIDSLFFYIIIATIVGARLGHVFFYGWDYYSQNPSEIFKVWHGGLASHGGAFGILIALYIHSKLVTKRSMVWALDRILVPTALVTAFIRFGNLMNSEIYGFETSLPWGIIFERNGEVVAKHPTQLYEALAYLLTFGILMFLYWRTNSKNKPGLLLGTFFVLMFSSRFLIEFIKENQEAFESEMALNMGQWLSVPFILFGVFLVVRAIQKPEKIYKNMVHKNK
ncbi:MAG: prolipoprotein diacylglyceryl transferase [Bacteroidetes bacterium]|nr:prolipoprotein diacylglyceryl transferase [Bacteroidota bacterium]